MKVIESSILNKYIVGRVSPHIYAFSTKMAPNSLKIGDTYRPLNTRLSEWKKHFPDLTHEFDSSAELGNDKIFRDHQIHEFLINEKKLNRLKKEEILGGYYSKEFFKNADKRDIEDAIFDIKKSFKENSGKYKIYTNQRLPVTYRYTANKELKPRKNQLDTIERFKDAIDKGNTNLLLYAVMRFGKSFTSIYCAKEINAKLILIVSAKADVKEEWKKTIQSDKNFVEFNFIDKNDLDRDLNKISNSISSKDKNIIFLTLQDLSGNMIKNRHKDLFDNKIDMLIVDETHFGARAEEYGKVLKSVGLNKNEIKNELNEYDEININESIKQLKPKVTLHLSGTPYRILMGNEFKNEEIIAFYQYADIVDDKNEWDKNNLHNSNLNEWDNPYYGFPQMIRFAFNPNKSSIKKLNELKQKGYDNSFFELFRPLKIKKSRDNLHKNFKNEKEVLELLKIIDGTKEDENILSFLNDERIKNAKMCQHIVCVLPYKASCDALEDLIKKNNSDFININEYNIINISGVDNPKLYKNIIDVKNKIKAFEEKGSKTITLTVNRMLTGSTVEEWDTMLYFKDTASPQEYDQSIFRIQNQFIKTYKNIDGEVIKFNMKPQTLLVDFDIDRLFKMQERKSVFYNINSGIKGSNPLEESISKELKISPIISINKNKLVEINASNIIDKIREYSQNKSIMDEALDIPYDRTIYDVQSLKFLRTLEPIDSKKGIVIKPYEGEGSELDIDSYDDDQSVFEEINISNDPKDKLKDDTIEKKIAAYYAIILLYSFLTKTRLRSLEDLINSLSSDENNKRIASNIGLKKLELKSLFEYSSSFTILHLDRKINNINTLGYDKDLEPVKRAEMAMKRFSRVSVNEIVMPKKVSRDLVSNIPKKYITNKTLFLDLSSKQGEIAISICQIYKQIPKENIYSISTSRSAYELTRKVYELLDIPLKNVLNFSSFDLLDNEKSDLINTLKNLNFDIIIGGPPFQEIDGGGRGDSGSALYIKFIELAIKLNPQVVSLFIKANWYSGGKAKGMIPFRESMINDKRISLIDDYPDPEIYFKNNASIRGGVCNILWERDHNGDCLIINNIGDKVFKEKRAIKFMNENILIRYNIGLSILKKVLEISDKFMQESVWPRNPFKIDTKYKFTEVQNQINSSQNSVKVYLPKKKFTYIDLNFVNNHRNIDQWKVIVAKTSPGADDLPHSIISSPIISEPGSIGSESHLLICVVENENQAKNLESYMKTRFFRFMMSLAKNNHNLTQKIFRYVPHLDFSVNWSDKMLYEKYSISNSEIDFIKLIVRDWGERKS